MTIPKLGGRQVAQEIEGLRTELPVIACTGYGDTLGQEELLAAGIHMVVAKPVMVSDLARQIRRVLAAGPDA
ncbi:MAG: response regulator [Polyangiaceae bacterium]|nr:response regulator [Polyangiaceae bacterium]